MASAANSSSSSGSSATGVVPIGAVSWRSAASCSSVSGSSNPVHSYTPPDVGVQHRVRREVDDLHRARQPVQQQGVALAGRARAGGAGDLGATGGQAHPGDVGPAGQRLGDAPAAAGWTRIRMCQLGSAAPGVASPSTRTTPSARSRRQRRATVCSETPERRRHAAERRPAVDLHGVHDLTVHGVQHGEHPARRRRRDGGSRHRDRLGVTPVAGSLHSGLMRKWLPLVAICTGTFMLLVDVTIVNVALPDIATGSADVVRPAPVGGRRLRAGAGRAGARRRVARRPVRPAEALPDRAGAVRAGLAGLRAGARTPASSSPRAGCRASAARSCSPPRSR